MARDYRHGHSHKKAFQRKSQQDKKVVTKRSFSLALVLGLFFVVVSLGVFLVISYFMSQENDFLVSPNKTTSQSVMELKEVVETPIKKDKISQSDVVTKIEAVLPESSDAGDDIQKSSQNIYSFYQGLGQTEVVVEAELISVALSQPYYIQAGSFGSEKMASQELRRLAKHGQKLTLSALTKKNRTYYRLRAGPFKDRLKMNKKRNELRKLGVDTLLIKAARKL